ncbi:hypothetical protein TI04_09625 [Achromatium sp. WMS2]|nr:hypothetical protein TI04_09625 [Achromatium sp. WMS2]
MQSEEPIEPTATVDEILSTNSITSVETDSADTLAVETTDSVGNNTVEERIENIEKALQAGMKHILDAFTTKIAYDAFKQQQIDRLHEELQQHRGNLIARTMRPLVHGVIHLHDTIGKLIIHLEKVQDQQQKDFCAILQGIQEDVEILLSHNGVKAYREGNTNAAFDPRRQRVL